MAGEEAFGRVGGLLDALHIKGALQEALGLAHRTNQYISEQEPWKLVKSDLARAKTVIYAGLQLVDYLKLLLCPFLPFSSQQLHEMLGYVGTIAPLPVVQETNDPDGNLRKVLTGDYKGPSQWTPRAIPIGQTIHAPKLLFEKLEVPQASGAEEA